MNEDAQPRSGIERQDASATKLTRIAIMGHVGNQNLGDESIIEAVIQNIRRRDRDTEIIGLTLSPADTQARHGIVSFPIRGIIPAYRSASTDEESTASVSARQNASVVRRAKDLIDRIPVVASVARRTLAVLETLPRIVREVLFLLECRRRVRGLDLLIIAGSHQLNDFVGGPWAFPYTVLKWTLLAREAGAKVVFLSLGAGPISSWMGRVFLRQALKLASYRSYRDVTAKREVDGLFEQTDEVVPDLAFSLDLRIDRKESARAGRRIVGINPMPLYTDYWHETNLSKYEIYVRKLAKFADRLVEGGCEVHFIPTQLRVDPSVIADVRKHMATSNRPECEELIVEPIVQSLDHLLSALGAVDIMVATRYHGILLSLALQKPVLAIAYHDKSRDVMEWLGLAKYSVDGDSFTADALTDVMRLLESDGSAIATSLRQQLPGFRSAVQAQYDEVFQLVELDITH